MKDARKNILDKVLWKGISLQTRIIYSFALKFSLSLNFPNIEKNMGHQFI